MKVQVTEVRAHRQRMNGPKQRIVAVLFSLALVSVSVGMMVLVLPEGRASSAVVKVPHTVLNHGRIAGYDWRVLARHWRAKTEQAEPCIDVSVDPAPTPMGRARFTSVCGSLERFPNVLAVGSNAAGKEITVAGIAVDRKVHRLKVFLSGGQVVWRTPRLISKGAARVAHVARFRFTTLVILRKVAVPRVLGFDAAGRLIAGR